MRLIFQEALGRYIFSEMSEASRTKFGKNVQINHKCLTDLFYVSDMLFNLDTKATQANGVETPGQIYTISSPVRFSVRWAKCLSEFFVPDPGPTAYKHEAYQDNDRLSTRQIYHLKLLPTGVTRRGTLSRKQYA